MKKIWYISRMGTVSNKVKFKIRGQMMQPLTFVYFIAVASEMHAGLRRFTETVSVTIESGDVAGNNENFKDYLKHSLEGWYDGALVTCLEKKS